MTREPCPGHSNRPYYRRTQRGIVCDPHPSGPRRNCDNGHWESKSECCGPSKLALIPVFQFGVFSDSDLDFFAGPNFDFGGRIHTNGNLFLAEGTGKTLTLHDKITVLGKFIARNLRMALSATLPILEQF